MFNQYSFGLNPGYYGPNWSTKNILDLGNAVGAKTYRMQLYDRFLSQYGYDNLIPDYEHLKAIGAVDITAMVGGVSDANKWNPFNIVHPQWGDEGRMWKGMYEPTFVNGAINPANTFALYLSKTVLKYGQYVSIWEVVNEPDFSYTNKGYMADVANQGWEVTPPTPEDLQNIRVTVPYYVRLLRVAWEVIKKLQPSGMVAVGGLGNQSFLKWVLAYTDNPTDGSVTAQYPLKGGEYFDVLSFHTYPEYSTLIKWWDNAKGAVAYLRNSDNFVKGHFLIKDWMQKRLSDAGYNGTTKPLKHFICTETGAARTSSQNPPTEEYGSNELQVNYNIKCHVKTLIDGQIKQTYWYQTSDGPNSTTVHWDSFGLYLNVAAGNPPNATPSDQGKAQKVLSDMLKGKTFDKDKTTSLNLPAAVDGGAFKDAAGAYTYVLWAKTTQDMSEQASASLTLPTDVQVISWDGVKGATGKTVQLTGRPVYLVPTGTVTPDPQPQPTPTETYTGRKGYWLLESKRVYYKVYKLSNGTYQIKTGDYNWYKLP